MKIEKCIIQALKNIDMPSTILPILADRDGVEPKAPYLIIQIISTTSVGTPRKTVNHTEDNVVEAVFQLKEFDIALTLHTDTSGVELDWFEYFHSGIFSDMVDWSFSQQGTGILSADSIMYQSSPVDGKNYKRAILNMTVSAEVTNEYKVFAMNGVDIVGKGFDGYDETVGGVNVNVDFYK